MMMLIIIIIITVILIMLQVIIITVVVGTPESNIKENSLTIFSCFLRRWQFLRWQTMSSVDDAETCLFSSNFRCFVFAPPDMMQAMSVAESEIITHMLWC